MCKSDIKVYIRELESYLISRGYKINRSSFDSLKKLTFEQLREVRDQLKKTVDIKNTAESNQDITAEVQKYLAGKFAPLNSIDHCFDDCEEG